MSTITISLTALALAVILVRTVVAYGSIRWTKGTRELRAHLESGRLPMQPRVVDFRELEGLPVPVQRYFRMVLREGQPMVSGVHLQHQGTFNMGEQSARWKPFVSDQRVITQRPGFDWNARIRMMPGIAVQVHDAYVAGEGMLHATLFGLFSVVNQRGGKPLSEGELMRFLAEAVWYPTALLPSQGVHWEAIDDHSAHATLTDASLTVRLKFGFDSEDLIESVRAEARGRMAGNEVIPTSWQGRFWNYRHRGELLVPVDGEVAWLLPEGAKSYWRGHITGIAYEFAIHTR
jgi:hypothetical protein